MRNDTCSNYEDFHRHFDICEEIDLEANEKYGNAVEAWKDLVKTAPQEVEYFVKTIKEYSDFCRETDYNTMAEFFDCEVF